MHLTVDEFIEYTDDERTKWEHWFITHNNEPLNIPLAGDICPTIGSLIIHIFRAEAWYAHLLRDEPLTEESQLVKIRNNLAADRADEIFGFGRLTREVMRAFIREAQSKDWARVYEVEALDCQVRSSARKIVMHTLMHEVRHWAQMAALIRQRGFAPPGYHDLIFSGTEE